MSTAFSRIHLEDAARPHIRGSGQFLNLLGQALILEWLKLVEKGRDENRVNFDYAEFQYRNHHECPQPPVVRKALYKPEYGNDQKNEKTRLQNHTFQIVSDPQ